MKQSSPESTGLSKNLGGLFSYHYFDSDPVRLRITKTWTELPKLTFQKFRQNIAARLILRLFKVRQVLNRLRIVTSRYYLI